MVNLKCATTLRSMSAVRLKKLAKNEKIVGWYNLKKDDLVEALLLVEEPVTDHKNIKEDVEEFEKKGGEIVRCKDGRKLKVEPPTQRSALKSSKKKRTTKAKQEKDQSKKVSTPKRNNPEVITLKQICDDLGISSYKVRKHFRAEGIKKPGKQWAWDKSQKKEITEIKKVIGEIK